MKNENVMFDMNNVKNLPMELRGLENWCNWYYKEDLRTGDWRKIPKNSFAGGNASAKDRSTWNVLPMALDRVDENNGLGFMFEPPYVGIDIDDVEDEINRHLAGDYDNNVVSEFIFAFNSFTEISTSGTGIHILIKGKLPEGRRHNGKFEMYTERRYFIMTGDVIHGEDLTDHTDTGVLEKFHKKYIGAEVKKRQPRRTVSGNQTGTNNLGDDDIVRLASKSKSGEDFKSLYAGNYEGILDDEGRPKYPSHSEADGALTSMLAFWTAKDGNQMDRIFRESGLMRDKWDEMRGHDTYGDITIDSAIKFVTEVFIPNAYEMMAYSEDYHSPHLEYIDADRLKDIWKTNLDEPILEDIGTFPVRPADDTGNAYRIIDRYGDVLKYNFTRNKYYVYNGQFWELSERGMHEMLTNFAVDSIQDEDWVEGIEVVDEESEKVFEKREEDKQKHITRSRSRAAKTNMRELAKVYVPVLDDDFDKDDHIFNAENGYINLRDGSLHKGNKRMMLSMMADAEYDESKSSSKWLEFLNLIFGGDQEMIDFVQRAAGYSLTGNINEEVMFFLVGDGGNGKSTFLETLTAAMGTYTSNLNISSLGFRADNSIKNDWAKLQRTRLVTTSEPSEGFKFDEGQLKDMTGGDEVTSRFLFNEEFDYTPHFKLWVATNHKPIIVGEDDGIWRRFLIIPFEQKFEGEDKDDQLKKALLDELPGVLQWAVEGAIKWYEAGLNPPKKVTAAVSEYRDDMDIIGAFVRDCCVVDRSSQVSASSVWEGYREWAEGNLYDPTDHTMFGQEFVKRFDRKRTSTGNVYVGVKLK